ncbi:hypothetical protein ACFE04_010219 [Oxalis oulophora]
MQDIHSIGIFTTDPGGGDRRLRPHHHHLSGDINNTQQNLSHPPPALKCPRCDSLNTKFCYYNNYNLSQPRHFCKSCRRYWTKGGVLRNVPVGGGCRKTKRSSSSKVKVKASPERSEKVKASSSSSESSSTLTAAATATTAVDDGGRIETVPDNKNNEAFELSVDDNGGSGACYEQPALNGDWSSFTSLINSASNETMSFGFSNILGGEERWPRQQHHQQQHEEFKGLLLDQTVQNEFSALVNNNNSNNNNNRSTVNNNGGGFGPLDWQGNEGFDLTNTVDQSYWSQTQYDQDHSSLYLP